MSTRLYRVEDIITVVGVGYVEATSKAEAKRKATDGEVEFYYNNGQDIRRGDGLHVYVSRDAAGRSGGEG